MAKQLNLDTENLNNSEEQLDNGKQLFHDVEISDEELKELFKKRQERYTENKREEYDVVDSGQRISPKTIIVFLLILFVYFMTAFILKTTGVISELVMAIMIIPVVIIFAVIYLIRKKKHD